jgi:hypothetical protein
MFDGSVKMIQDVKSGDLLMGDDSTSRKVLETTTGVGELYEIIPKNGDSLKVNKNHILCFKASNYNYVYYDKNRMRYGVRCFMYVYGLPKKTTVFFPLARKTRKFHRKGMKFYTSDKEARDAADIYLDSLKTNPLSIQYQDVIEISLADYVNLTKATQSAMKLYRVGVDYSEQDLCFDPWLLGLWLGDGTQLKPQITTADQEIVEEMKTIVYKYGLQVNKVGNTKYAYGFSAGKSGIAQCNHFRNFLREMGLNQEKHIPDIFKFNSREVRLSVLAGLVDSDGYLEKNKAGYAFTMTKKNERLVTDIVEVARSLGFASYKTYVNKTCTNGKDGPVVCECIGFSIYGEGIEDIPVRLK